MLHGTSAAAGLTADELSRLEQIVNSTPLHLPITRFYESFRRAYVGIDGAQAHEAAFGATFGPYPTSFHVLLMRRTKPMLDSPSPELRHRAAVVLMKVGRAFANSGSLVDLAIGRSLIRRAADLMQDSELKKEADAFDAEFRSMQEVAKLMAFAAEWPLSEFSHELTDMKMTQELDLYRQLRPPQSP